MISQTVEYALRAVVTIAQHEGTPCTTERISRIAQIPAPYLSKMIQGLVRAKLLRSKRGLNGGFVLVKEPAKLSILEIINAIEPLKRIHTCPLDIGAHQGTLCPLHRRLDNAMAKVEESFRNTTVAELLAPSGNFTPLCEKDKLLAIDLGKAAKPSAKPKAKAKARKKKKK